MERHAETGGPVPESSAEKVSLTPGMYPEGPKRDAARAARAAFFTYLHAGQEPEAVMYRRAAYNLRIAREELSRSRTAARRAFKKKWAAQGAMA